jgi:polar amino acid transport system substrate-binding protein
MYFLYGRSIFLAAFALLMLAAPAAADTLTDIRARGELLVGVKEDFPPYGFRNADGQIVGIEADLAANLAWRLGVKLHIEPVRTFNREQILNDGKVDLLIATMVISVERARVVGFIDPPYYAGGLAGLARSEAGLKSDPDLTDKSVCVVKGNIFNQELQSLYAPRETLTVNGVNEAKLMLQSGRCVLFAYSENLLVPLKAREQDQWKDYDFVDLTEIDPRSWGIAIRRADLGGNLAKFLSSAILEWHRTGYLIQTEKKWLGANTRWLLGVAEKYKARR